jgi:hypothetical protein
MAMKIDVGRKGKYLIWNGEIVKPRQCVGVDGFKWTNHIVAGIKSGDERHFDDARMYVEEICKLGCRRMRSPLELMFWGPPYFNLPTDGAAPYNIANVANTLELVDLATPRGSRFKLTPLLKETLRYFIIIAREFGIVIEIPLLWTIKGQAGKRTKFYPDPRIEDNKTVSSWNEHFLANVGRYVQLLRTEGEGEGASRVDPGGLNLEIDFANEYQTHADVFTRGQLRNVSRRWQTRDAPDLPVIGISEASGYMDEYDPPLESRKGPEGFDGPSKHPPRSKEKNRHGKKIDWDETGTEMRNEWPEEYLIANESQLAMTEEQRAYWVPLIPKWAGLGSTDMGKYARMIENFLDNHIYVYVHTFRGMDAGWPWTPQTIVEEVVAQIADGTYDPPPPPPPPPPPEDKASYVPIISLAYDEILGRPRNRRGKYRGYHGDEGGLDSKNKKMQQGVTEAEMREEMIRSKEFANRNKE